MEDTRIAVNELLPTDETMKRSRYNILEKTEKCGDHIEERLWSHVRSAGHVESALLWPLRGSDVLVSQPTQ